MTKSYRTKSGRHYVFRDVCAEFPAGANIGIIGPNGSGKSTLLRILGGIDFADSGRIESDQSFSWPLGLRGGFVNHLSGRENCRMVCRLYGREARQIQPMLAKMKALSGIGEYFEEPVKTYSSGMAGRLGFALSMAFDFDYFLIDEITAVGDAGFKVLAKQALEEKARRSKVIMVSHNMGDIKRFCDVGVYIDNGRMEVCRDIDEAIRRYLPGDQAPEEDLALLKRGARLTRIDLDKVPLPADTRETLDAIESLLTTLGDKLAHPQHTIRGAEDAFHNALGVVQQQLGNEGAAIEAFQRGLSLNPYHPDIHQRLITLLSKHNRIEEEKAAVLAALKLFPGHALLQLTAAGHYLRAGDHDAARAAVRKALELKPRDSRSWNLLARIELGQDNLDEAMDAQIKAIEINPRNPSGYNQLALVLARCGTATAAARARYKAHLCPAPDKKNPLAPYKAIHKTLRKLEDRVEV